MLGTVAVVAQNLRELRSQRAISLAELASRSGVAKGTISALERGQGNPTIETLFALAYALDATLADLVEEQQGAAVELVRASERPLIEGRPLDARLLQRARHPAMTVETYDLLLHPGADHHAKAHRPGTLEAMYVVSGQVVTGPLSEPIELGPGDYLSYPADCPHLYRSSDTARAVLIMTVPRLAASG